MTPPPSARVEAVPSSGVAPDAPRPERRAPLAMGPDVVHLEFQDHRLFHELLGRQDENVKAIEKTLRVRIGVAGKSVSISGDQVNVDELASFEADPIEPMGPVDTGLFKSVQALPAWWRCITSSGSRMPAASPAHSTTRS